MKVADLLVQDIVALRCSDPLSALMDALDGSQDIFPVLGSGEKVSGTVSEQDLIRVLNPTEKTFPFGPNHLVREGLARQVEDVMTPRPATVRPDDPVRTAIRLMSDLHLPQLVVVDRENRLLGLIRGRDIFRAAFGQAR